MKVAGVEGKTLAIYGALGFGAYLFVTKILPGLLKNLAKAPGEIGKNVLQGGAQSAGQIGAAALKVAPTAIDTLLEEFGADPQALERFGGAIGSGMYAATHAFSPEPGGPDLFYTVNFPDGSRHAIASTVVDSKGRFKYQNVMYQIKDDASGAHYATRM